MVASTGSVEKSPYDTEFFQKILRSKEFGMWCNHQDALPYKKYADLFLSKFNIDVNDLQALPDACRLKQPFQEMEEDGIVYSYEIHEYTVTWKVNTFLTIEVLYINNKPMHHCARFSINKYNSLYVIYDPMKREITETFIRNIVL